MESCRFYQSEFPAVNDLVMVQIVRIEEHGAYCDLLEYDHIEGMLLTTELSKRRIRSISKLIRVGQIQCCAVLRSDNGTVDLSKKRVSAEESRIFEFKYGRAKTVQSVVKYVAASSGMKPLEAAELLAWPLYKHFSSAYDALRRVASGTGDDVIAILRNSLNFPAVEKVLLEIVARKLTPEPLKIRADIEVSCFASNGIQAIKAALLEGRSKSLAEAPLTIKLVAPPQYMVMTTTLSKEDGFTAISACLKAIQMSIESVGGSFNIRQKAELIGETGATIVELEESSSKDDTDEDVSE
jgi:translation initiation factor 2 subunit 1